MNPRAAFHLLTSVMVLSCFAAALPASAESILEQEKRYAQNDEELIIRDFFQDRRGGVFLDVGCVFPIQYSTTYYLEKHLGWTGIGVDALPIYAKNWREFRPQSQFFSLYVSDHSDETQKFYRVGIPALSSGTKDREFGG